MEVPLKRYMKRNKSQMCLVQPELVRMKMNFIMETGCGHDVMCEENATKAGMTIKKSESGISFQTAHGVTAAEKVASFQSNTFEEEVEAFILESTPSVFSVGKRCTRQGYSFLWPAGKEPMLINPDGKVIKLLSCS